MKSLRPGELLPFAMPRVTPGSISRARPPLVAATAAAIVEEVRSGGDAALREAARRFGDPQPREVERGEMLAALSALPATLRAALERTHERIARFAEAQRAMLRPFSYVSDGFVMGQRLVPLDSAGAYVPAGRHPLPSTALMTIVPARVAGVEDVIVCTPRADPVTLAACAIAGARRVFLCGGAQAIAALAYGTDLIPRVAKIVGPGNAYVAAAKRCVAGTCGVDLEAGPSEVLVIASRDAEPRTVARSLLAEAEHDVYARAYLLCDSEAFAAAVDEALAAQLATLETGADAAAALASSGTIVCHTFDSAPQIANGLAVEHVELHGAAAIAMAEQLRNYGGLFVGTSAAFGDYGAGPNHTLPTNAAARFASGLSVYDFLLVRPFVCSVDPSPALVSDARTLAAAEGLPAHARALT